MSDKTIINVRMYNQYPSIYYFDVAEVADEACAVRESLARLATTFNIVTYNMNYVLEQTPDGEKERMISLSVLEESPHHWVGVEKIYSPDDIVDELTEIINDPTAVNNTDLQRLEALKDVFQKVADIMVPHSYKLAFIRTPVQRPDYTPLQEGQKVFNKAGQQIWPKP